MLPELTLTFTGTEHRAYQHTRARPDHEAMKPIPLQSSGKNAEGWWPHDDLSGRNPYGV